MTAPERTVEFVYGLASALAIATAMDGVAELELPPRDHSAGPAARRAQVRQSIQELASECDRVLSRKSRPPAGVARATLGRRLASRGERIDIAAGTYTPGPGFHALIAALLDDAATESEERP